MQKAFAGPVGLDPLAVEDELRNRALAGAPGVVSMLTSV